MKKIGKFLSENAKYRRYKKPLEAARICEVARRLSDGRFEPVSFRNGLLTLKVESPAAAQNLQLESEKIIAKINKKLGRKAVEKVRFKIT